MEAQTAEFITPQTQALAQRQQTGLEVTVSAALEAQVRAGIEARYALAIRQPRDLDLVRQRILKECKRPGFAAVARYSKPQGGKKIEGPSIRFAEMAIRNMTNVSTQSMVVYEDLTRRIVRMSVVDVESNVSAEADITINKTVERSNGKDREVLGMRQNKEGKPVYIVACTDDELLVKQNALLSKAKRQLGLSLIPGDIIDEAQHVVLQTQKAEDQANPDAQRNKVFDTFAELGITPPEIKEYLGREATTGDLPELRGLYQAIKQGDVIWRDLLEERRNGESGDASKTLADKLKAKAERAKPAEPSPQSQAAAPSSGSPRADSAPDISAWKTALDEATDIPALDDIKAQAEQKLTGEALKAFWPLYSKACDRVRRG